MDTLTSFGQIDIYDDKFPVSDEWVKPKYSPSLCAKKGYSYTATLSTDKKIVLPIMIGSEIHNHYFPDDNPLGIQGYFIMNGTFKSVNSMYMRIPPLFSKDRTYIEDGRRIDIKSMGKYTQTYQQSTKLWTIPINWEEMIQYSEDPNKLHRHLEICIDHMTLSKPVKEQYDIIKLAYMFDAWLGLRTPPREQWRLVTAGELIQNMHTYNNDVENAFKLNKWNVLHLFNVYGVSEDMALCNTINNIEAIRRIAVPTNRETMQINQRLVKPELHRGKICPTQTNDGVGCGAILYLTKGATVLSKQESPLTHIKQNSTGVHVFENRVYKGRYSYNKIMKHESYKDIVKYGQLVSINNDNGVVKEGGDVSYTVSLLPYKNHNPAIRAMFTCSMMKQALSNCEYIDLYPINDVKKLEHNGEQPLVGPELPCRIGYNVTCAMMMYYGYNIEDAVVVSESFTKKFSSVKYEVYTKQKRHKIFDTHVEVGMQVVYNTPLFSEIGLSKLECINTVYSSIEGVVTECTSRYVRIKRLLPLCVGDKVTNRHGQKGIISLILPDTEMPRIADTKRQIDIIMNPHAIPSRMTYGQILEMGNKIYDVILASAHTIKNIMVGSVYYISLRHQVIDKAQHQLEAQIDEFSKQAVKGRSKKGGLRFGHMERDILLSKNAWNIIEDLYTLDKYKALSCDKCYTFDIVRRDGVRCKCVDTTTTVFDCHYYLILLQAYLIVNNRKLQYNPATKHFRLIACNIQDYPQIELEDSASFNFGYDDPLDIRRVRSILILPRCARTETINTRYRSLLFGSQKDEAIHKLYRQTLRSKSGIYHEYVEGHKVDHCIRSVIVPDPTLKPTEIIVPDNADIGTDIGLLNRQPSLSQGSIMCVTISQNSLKQKVIKINPLLCKSFNADFDGDEMAVFGLKSKAAKNEANDKFPVVCEPTQDYILCEKQGYGDDLIKFTHHFHLSCDKSGVYSMIHSGSKGKQFNYDHLYKRIGDIIVNNQKVGASENCYMNGVNNDEWYMLACGAREAAASIGVNTPFTGHLETLAISYII